MPRGVRYLSEVPAEESFFAPPRRAGRYPPAAGAAAAMALCTLSEDEQRILFVQLCNVLEPRIVVYFSSTSSELRELTQALLQQLRADHEACLPNLTWFTETKVVCHATRCQATTYLGAVRRKRPPL